MRNTSLRPATAVPGAILAFLVALLVAPLPAPAQDFESLSEDVREVVEVSEPVVALTGVRLVDGTGAAPVEGRTVLIRDGRIDAVGPDGSVEIPEDARTLDLSGHTVIPGIVGLHDHSFYTTPQRRVQSDFTAPRLYLASGVTTVRTTGSIAPYGEINLRRAIEAGEIPGPRMVITGPYITGGADEALTRVHAGTPDEARRVVDYWISEGVDWFKFYTGISRASMAAAIEAAHERGAQFTGHICSVTFREAVDRGIDNIEHGFLTNSGWVRDKEPDACPPNVGESLERVEIGGPEVQATIDAMVQNDVAMTATPAVYELFVAGRPPLEQRVLNAMSDEARSEYLASREQISGTEDAGIPAELFDKALAFDSAFVASGGLLAAGVDPTGNGGALFGYGDQRNFELLVEGGFSPVEALRVMTLNGATVLGRDDELGSVEAGKLADLVVIEGDPTADPARIRNVRLVFKDGVGYDPAPLIEAVEGQVGIR